MSERLERQELENTRQADIIARLEAALNNDRKWKPEVPEAGKNIWLP